MSLAQGSVAYVPEHSLDGNVYRAIEVGEDVKLIDSNQQRVVIITTNTVQLFGYGGVLLHKVWIISLTNHTPIDVRVTNYGCVILTSYKSLVVVDKSKRIEVGDAYVAIDTMDGDLCYALREDGVLDTIKYKGNLDNIQVSRKGYTLDMSYGMLRILAIGSKVFGWNEEVLLKNNYNIPTISANGGIVKCMRVGFGIFVLYDNGDVVNVEMLMPKDNTRLVGSGYADICSNVLVSRDHDTYTQVVIGISHSGVPELLSEGHIDHIPSQVTLTSSDIAIQRHSTIKRSLD